MRRPSILLTLLLASTTVLATASLVSARAEEPKDTHSKSAAAGAHGDGATKSHAEPDILEPAIPLMFVTISVFVVLMIVLWKFAWGPLSEALTERERKQTETIAAAESAKTESARLLVEHKRQLDTAAEQVRQLLEEARRQADANALSIVQKAQAEAEASRERAEREIGSAKDQALSEIWTKTADLAVSVAGKILSKEMNHDDHRRLVDSAMGELSTTNGHGGNRA